MEDGSYFLFSSLAIIARLGSPYAIFWSDPSTGHDGLGRKGMKVSKEKVVSSRSSLVQVWHPIDTADGSFGPCLPRLYFRVSRSGQMDACISGMKLIGMLSSVNATYKGLWIRARSGEGYEEREQLMVKEPGCSPQFWRREV